MSFSACRINRLLEIGGTFHQSGIFIILNIDLYCTISILSERWVLHNITTELLHYLHYINISVGFLAHCNHCSVSQEYCAAWSYLSQLWEPYPCGKGRRGSNHDVSCTHFPRTDEVEIYINVFLHVLRHIPEWFAQCIDISTTAVPSAFIVPSTTTETLQIHWEPVYGEMWIC